MAELAASKLPARKRNRLKEYDYSQNGAYFITVCVKDKQRLLWVVGARTARPILSDVGKIVDKVIRNIPLVYDSVAVDNYVIMPNHIHLILVLNDGFGRALRAPTVSAVMNQMKGYVTKQLGTSIWQKSFHDHVIRDEAEYREIWQYVEENPLKWKEDCYYNEEA